MEELKDKMCPFFKSECRKLGCTMYNALIDNCDINVLSYNMYKLRIVEEKRVEVLDKLRRDKK